MSLPLLYMLSLLEPSILAALLMLVWQRSILEQTKPVAWSAIPLCAAVPILCTGGQNAPYTRVHGSGVIADPSGIVMTDGP
jgi:hypothetical protein